MSPQPVFSLTLDELNKVIDLTRGILPDVDGSPAKTKHKIEKLAAFFEAHREILEKRIADLK